MSSLKGLLFTQYATEGLNQLVTEMQEKYTPKKGRRFNDNNITYEISRPSLKDNVIEFEISSKIPEDELEGTDSMKRYFEEIKKKVSKGKIKPTSIEMENIIWDSRKDTEKQREYVKLVYQYPLDQFFDDKEVTRRHEEIRNNKSSEDLPKTSSTFTQQGTLALKMVGESIQEKGRKHIDHLINANNEVRASLVS
jgi:hypothetical protein